MYKRQQEAYAVQTLTTAGVATGARLDTESAVSFVIRTALRGKSYRGSKRLGGVPLGLTLGDRLTSTGVTDYKDYIAVMVPTGTQLTDVNGNIYVASVLSRKLSQLRVNPTTVINNQALTFQIQERIASMRRRKTIGQLA